MQRLLLATWAVVVLALGINACDEDCNYAVGPCHPSCPASFTEGETCSWENQQCVFSTGACREIEAKRTVCTCANQPGAFRWECEVKFCSCTCPCGILATASCDALECADAEDECPEVAMPFCEQHCADGGTRDAGGDAGDAAADHGAADGAARDGGAPDSAQRDSRAPDSAAPDPDGGADAAVAQPDGPLDAAAE